MSDSMREQLLQLTQHIQHLYTSVRQKDYKRVLFHICAAAAHTKSVLEEDCRNTNAAEHLAAQMTGRGIPDVQSVNVTGLDTIIREIGGFST